ncbi:hypothetical protein SKAU_G00010780 [Synaphobranchus kaupii]|uniref:Uncharacterized protein n=1 Tax=Synaphobranchus kaupii TaxID=118154 RepID=A0A9Q1G9X8_SYNKA|nr:hypothetical protein SKAU_G00010780 [Synaphobranchus kaupii]
MSRMIQREAQLCDWLAQGALFSWVSLLALLSNRTPAPGAQDGAANSAPLRAQQPGLRHRPADQRSVPWQHTPGLAWDQITALFDLVTHQGISSLSPRSRQHSDVTSHPASSHEPLLYLLSVM